MEGCDISRPKNQERDGRVVTISLCAAFVVLVAWRAGLAVQMKGPSIVADEAGYLLQGRYLASAGPTGSMNGATYYHFGSSLVFIPAHLLASTPAAIFRGVVVTNALLLGLLFPLYYVAGRSLFGLTKARAAVAATVVSLYPPYVLHAGIAWAESLFIALFAVLAVCLTKLNETRTVAWCTATGTTVGLLYMAHPRALVLAPMWVVGVSALGLWRWLPRRAAAAGAVATVLLALVTRVVADALRFQIWGADRRSPEGWLLRRLLTPANWDDAVLQAVGQVWYLAAATMGLAVLGAMHLVQLARTPRLRFPAVALLAACTGIFASSVTNLGVPTRADHFVYGRYNDGFASALICGGMALVLTARPRVWQVASTVGVVVVSGAVVSVAHADDLATKTFFGVNTLGITGIVQLVDGPRIALITGILGVAILAVGTFWRWRPVSVGAVVVVAFLAGSSYAHVDYLRPRNHSISSQLLLAGVVNRLDAAAVAYDTSYQSALGYYGYQFWMNEVRFVPFTSAGQMPPADLVISSKSWRSATAAGARLIYLEWRIDQALWVVAGPLQDALAQRGFLLPDGFPAALPASAYRSTITSDVRSVTVGPGAPGVVSVSVTHAGVGSPWPALRNTGTGRGSVRVGLIWHLADRSIEIKADLPDLMYPGDGATVPILIDVPEVNGSPVPAGRYRGEIGLVQEGFTWFYEQGDATVPVEIVVQP